MPFSVLPQSEIYFGIALAYKAGQARTAPLNHARQYIVLRAALPDIPVGIYVGTSYSNLNVIRRMSGEVIFKPIIINWNM